jgi:AcrR family transcriptional regulator
METTTSDLRRARGDRTRRAVLDQAVQDASVRGLGALSLGGLAASAPVNKSAIAGLFGSKEGLQLAVVARAREIYTESVILPARESERGLAPRGAGGGWWGGAAGAPAAGGGPRLGPGRDLGTHLGGRDRAQRDRPGAAPGRVGADQAAAGEARPVEETLGAEQVLRGEEQGVHPPRLAHPGPGHPRRQVAVPDEGQVPHQRRQQRNQEPEDRRAERVADEDLVPGGEGPGRGGQRPGQGEQRAAGPVVLGRLARQERHRDQGQLEDSGGGVRRRGVHREDVDAELHHRQVGRARGDQRDGDGGSQHQAARSELLRVRGHWGLLGSWVQACAAERYRTCVTFRFRSSLFAVPPAE